MPAPACEPPYDDEQPASATTPPHLRVLPPILAPLALVPPITPGIGMTPTDVDAEDADLLDALDVVDVVARRTPTRGLPSPHRFSHALLQRLLEVFAGVRPLAQLQRDMTWEAFEALERCYADAPRTVGSRPTARAVHSVHVQAWPEGVAEVCASVDRGGRRVALALRLEGRDGAWRCTDLVGV